MADVPKAVVKLAVELVKHFAKQSLGEGAVNIISENLADLAGENVTEKLTAFFDQGEKLEKILAAFQGADTCFAQKCDDKLLRQMIHDKPFAGLPSLEKLATELPENLDSDQLLETLKQRFSEDWPGELSPEQLEKAAMLYRDCLERGLAAQADQLQEVIFLKLDRIENGVQDIRINTETLIEMGKRTERLVVDISKRLPEPGTSGKPIPKHKTEKPKQKPPKVPFDNPFGLRGRIEDPKRYLVRQPLVNEVFDELRKGVSLSIVGNSESGKSSLLWYICHAGPERLARPQNDFLFITLQMIRGEDELFQAICEQADIPFCRGYSLGRALKDRKLILCLDEAERMTWQGFTAELRDELRGLADGASAPFTLVIASGTPLDRLFTDSSPTSPLYNLCSRIDIKPFTLDEAQALSDLYLEGTSLHLSSKTIEEAWQKSIGQPGSLQQALKEAVEVLK